MVSSSLDCDLQGTVLANAGQWIRPPEYEMDSLEQRSMPAQTLESRVDRLERRVNRLEQLPDRMTALESQIVQLRTEMGGEFSAMRQEIHVGDEETRTLMRVLHEDVINRIALLQESRSPAKKRPRR